MKKLFLIIGLLCLSGCGAKPSGENLSYTLEDLTPQRELNAEYEDMAAKFDIESGKNVRELNFEDENHIDSVLALDAEKKLADMRDITDEIYSSHEDGLKIFADKKHPEMMVGFNVHNAVEGNGGYKVIYDVYETAAEYRPFIEDIKAKTGLMYSGMMLGRDFKDMNYDMPSDHRNFEYIGRNAIAFANEGYTVYNSGCYRQADAYKDLPLRVVFYMDKDKIKYVNIFFFTNDKTKTLTEKNIKELAFDSTAAELMSELYPKNISQKGTKNGVKYNMSKSVNGMDGDMVLNVLSLEY